MSLVIRTRPATLRERLICWLIGDLPIVANVTLNPRDLQARRSVLTGPGVAFDLGYGAGFETEADGVVGDAINPPPRAIVETGGANVQGR